MADALCGFDSQGFQVGDEMITRAKTKYVVIIILAAAMVVGIQLSAKIKRTVWGFGRKAQVNRVAGVEREVSIPVLLYHGIVKKDDGQNITESSFAEQMDALKENGYTAIDTHDLLDYFNGRTGLPEKPIMITFDDGRRDSVQGSEPALRKNHFKAVMFVVTNRQEHKVPGYLNWDELRAMNESGIWDLESHGYECHDLVPISSTGKEGHFLSNKMWLEDEKRLETDEEYSLRLKRDLEKVKDDLESEIKGLEVTSFAYPFGDFGRRGVNIDSEQAVDTIVDVIKDVYPMAFELNSNHTEYTVYEDSNRSLLKRFEVMPELTTSRFVATLEGFRTVSPSFGITRFNPDSIFGWFETWSDASIKDGPLVLSPADNETGAMAVSYGGHYWRDFNASAEISVNEGSSSSFIGRYRDNFNYVFCEIHHNSVILQQKVNGEDMILANIDYNNGRNGATDISLDFAGDTVSCTVDHAILIGPVNIDPSLGRGSVGFKVWNPEAGKASAEIRSLAVSSWVEQSKEKQAQ